MKRGKKAAIGEVLALIAGAAVASKIANMNISVIPDKIKPLLPVVAGFLLAKKGNNMIKAAGMGMIAAGGVKAVGSFFPSLGIGEAEEAYVQLNGAGNYALADGEDPSLGAAGNYALAGSPENYYD